jgi:prepilin-type processing-associated H-X9-DG protein
MLDQGNLYNQLIAASKTASTIGSNGLLENYFDENGVILPGGDTVLSVFKCPTSTTPSHTTSADGGSDPFQVGYAASDYHGNRGGDLNDPSGGSSDQRDGLFLKTEHHILPNTESQLQPWAGGNTGALGLKHITDGTSNTLWIGEGAYFRTNDDQGAWIGAVGTDESVLHVAGPGTPINTTIDDDAFFSFHTGGAQFSFADGSVHFISENISLDVYTRLGARNDGLVIGQF